MSTIGNSHNHHPSLVDHAVSAASTEPKPTSASQKKSIPSSAAKERIHSFTASNKRLDGIITVLKMATVGLVNLVASRISAIATKTFGFAKPVDATKKTPKQIDASNQQKAEEAKKLDNFFCILFYSSIQNINTEYLQGPTELTIHQGGQQSPAASSMLMLKNCIEAFEKLEVQLEKLDPAFSPKLAQILDNPTTETPGEIQKYFLNHLKREETDTKPLKELQSKFKSEVTLARGRNVPQEMTHEFGFKFDGSSTEGRFKETTKPLDQSLGTKFLIAANQDKYQNHIDYNNSLKGGIRPSAARGEVEVQGTGINAHVQKLFSKTKKEEDFTPATTLFRSGAFAVHDGNKPGLTKLKEIKRELDSLAEDNDSSQEAADQLLASCKFTPQELENANNNPIEALNTRIAMRTDLTVAQGLTKIAASIKEAASDPTALANAIKAGSFLHVEISALSDQNGGELNMIQDMKGAMDHIRDHVTVKFTTDPENEEISIGKEGKITMTLHVPELKAGDNAYPDEGLGIQSLLFTQGFNEQQSIGHAFGSKESTQDLYNEESYHLLDEWMNKSGNSEKMKDLQEHYSEKTKRSSKDIEGIEKIYDAVTSLKGGFGVVCKSGKDRTSGLVSHLLGRTATGTYDFDEDSKGMDLAQTVLQNALLEGNSYEITEQNVGLGGKGYAFNPMQQTTIPREMRPPPQLCRGGPS